MAGAVDEIPPLASRPHPNGDWGPWVEYPVLALYILGASILLIAAGFFVVVPLVLFGLIVLAERARDAVVWRCWYGARWVGMSQKRRKVLKRHKARVRQQQAGRCFYCDDPVAIADSTYDHFYPKAMYRVHGLLRHPADLDKPNLVLSCYACNHLKADRRPTLAEIDRFERVFGRRPPEYVPVEHLKALR